jgi:hypothetical protein
MTGKPPQISPDAPNADGTGSDYGPTAPMPPMPSATPQHFKLAETGGPRWRKKI